jgi:hypothetical protein
MLPDNHPSSPWNAIGKFSTTITKTLLILSLLSQKSSYPEFPFKNQRFSWLDRIIPEGINSVLFNRTPSCSEGSYSGSGWFP